MLQRLTAADVAMCSIDEPATPAPILAIQHCQLFGTIAIVEVQICALKGQQVMVAALPVLK